jgi:hypothetical protein
VGVNVAALQEASNQLLSEVDRVALRLHEAVVLVRLDGLAVVLAAGQHHGHDLEIGSEDLGAEY